MALKATTEDVAGVRIVSRGGPSLRLGPREADSTPSTPLSWLSATPFLLGVGSIGLNRRISEVRPFVVEISGQYSKPANTLN